MAKAILVALLSRTLAILVQQPGMPQCFLSAGPLAGVYCEHVGQEFQAALISLRHTLRQTRPLGYQVLIPVLHATSAHQSENCPTA